MALYKTSLEISLPEVVCIKTSLYIISTPKWLLIRSYGDFVQGLKTSPSVLKSLKKYFRGRGRSQSSRGISSYRGGSSSSSRTVYRKTNRDGSIVTRPAAMHVDEYQKAEEGDSDHEKGKKTFCDVVFKPIDEI